MKKALLLSGLALGLSLSTAGVAAPHGDGHHGMHRSGEHAGHMDRMTRYLELTDAQRQQIETARQAHSPELRDLRQQIREQHQTLREQSRDGFDEQAAREHADRLGELTGQAAFIGARMWSDIREVLTEEQRQKLADHMEQRRDHHHEGKR